MRTKQLYEVAAQVDGDGTAWRVIYTRPDLEYARAVENDMHDAGVRVRLDVTEPRKGRP
jgi:hypothetical protein